MSSHSLRHVVNIRADHAKVLDALTTADGLRGWTMAEVAEEPGAGPKWSLRYGTGPTFIWQISAQDPDKVVWTCLQGPGDSVGTTATFRLGSTSDDRVQLSFDHAGWPHQEGNYTKCNSLWGAMMHHLRGYAEKGIVAPTHS